MKHFSSLFIGIFIFSFFMACSGSDETEIEKEIIRELKLSVSDEDGFVTTNKIDYEFEIIDGNGGYVAEVSDRDGDKDAIVTIDGNKVLVNILVGVHYGPAITIKDCKGQEKTIHITSTDTSLDLPGGYTLLIDDQQTASMKVDFGAGAPYTIKRVRGNASDAKMEGDKVRVTGLDRGNTYYKVEDRRGSIVNLLVQTSVQLTMAKEINYLEVEAENNLSVYVEILWGTEWEIIGSTGKVTESVSVSRHLLPGGGETDNYYLSISTVDKGRGTDTITLRNNEGQLAVVKIKV